MIALSKSFHTARTASWRCTCWVALLWLLPASHGAQAADPFFFIQLTDPQFGMCASDADFQQETANNNLPLQKRTPWLNLFRQAGVTHVFAGHTHANSVAQFESLEMVVSCAIGKPLQKDGSGLRIVIVRDSGITNRDYHLGEIPNQIDLAATPAQDR